jgi:pyrroloquinoline quinone (PQQ) biosynthesis protein C
MTRITAKTELFRRDYQSDVLPALFRKQASDADFGKALPSPDSDFLMMVIDWARMTLLIACDELKDASLIKALQDKADEGIRIYLLLGNRQRNQTAIDALSGRCLIRSGVTQQGCLLLVDHTTTDAQGLMLMSDPGGVSGTSWAIQLEPQQIDDSFRSFCSLFWEKADQEVIQRQQQPNKTIQHPDGKVVVNHSHQLCGTLKDCLGDTLQHLKGATHSAFSAEGESWQLLLGTDSNAIEHNARVGVALTDQPVPSLLLSGEGNWLLPQHVDFQTANWCLKLSDQQSEKLATAYDQAMQDAAWQFQPEIRVGELSDEQALRFADQPRLVRSIESLRDVTLDDVKAQTIDSFLNNTPESLTAAVTGWQRDQLAHQIDYRVTIHPPYCPAGAKPDSLYKHWQDAEQDWQSRLGRLKDQQHKIDQQQQGVADKLKGFIKGFLLGQGQSAKTLNKEIEGLRDWSVTAATPAEREEHLEALKRLAAQIQSRGEDTAVELDKAQQNQQWEDKRDQLQKVLDDAKSAADTKSARYQQIENGRSASKSGVETEFLARWQEAVTGLSDEQIKQTNIAGLKPEQFLPKQLPDDQDQLKAVNEQADADCLQKKRETLSAMTVESALEWKNATKDKVWKKHYGSFERALADHQQGLNKIKRDIDEAENAMNKAQRTVEQARQALDDHGRSFVYQTGKQVDALSQQLGLKSSQTSTTPFSWPREELPASGTELRAEKQQRYLVIADTDQLPQARQDAKRLNANIVCDKESAHA